ncbi:MULTISPECIES: glycoside hydrolase family 38 C-terminal domain-containing protein [unclassified Nocardia]|uniref:glycoside hydrolase family 38 N-terminal domain-containing protein n=1 Tax=unclassified Nocardia TaxID=2637762 RepID=UPI001CE461ED|nr:MULTISPECIES: glycoside hydrolase family 38 C-terminal domain-containing protein [unclassified Nocardia]
MTAQIVAADSTDLFVGSAAEPRQVLRVTLRRAGACTIEVSGRSVRGSAAVPDGDGQVVVDVPLTIEARPGAELPVTVTAGTARLETAVTVAEPGWTMFMISHFHYDPVWWNTQAAFTQTWELQGNDGTTRPVWEHNGFNLVRAHLTMALSDPDYAFVLAEVDYLKPFWDTFPEYRSVLRDLIAQGRVEIMGGTYNEPNTNLTGSETTIRNLVYGIGYQRSIMGARPRTAWQLDVFGHDPQFPGLVAEAGLSSTSWARGPFHQWGPILNTVHGVGGDARHMQFPAEFEWLAPSGRGVLTHYMPNHYSAGWWMDSSATLPEAEQKVYELFQALKPVAATRNCLLPVGTDYTPPNKWVTEIHRDWNAKYVWPRFICGLPKDFFAAVHAELAERGVRPSPQSRDMNPIYTGKDVSYIDTKQAQRAAETAATDAEKLASCAALLGLGRYPEAALDKVWRHLAFGAHHDGITGSESDQVYIDLVTGWREAHDLAADVRDTALTALIGRIDTAGDGLPVVVVNTLSFTRTDLVRITMPPGAFRLVDDTGADVPFVVEADTATFVAVDVPGIGWRTWRLLPAETSGAGWASVETDTIGNEFFAVRADLARGGGLTSIRELASGRELLRDGGLGNELRVYEEYPQHPQFGEGPWHLVPTGRVVSSAERPASSLRVERCAAGQRLVVTGVVGEVEYEQVITLWAGLARIDLRARVIDFTGSDRLLRVKFAVEVPGARPVSEVAGAVIARGFALPDVDSAQAPWTLDNPANTCFALSSTAHLSVHDPDGAELGRAAIAVAEIVVPTLDAAADARDLVVALAGIGVTATTSTAAGSRYGWLDVDSNLPDVRIVLGGPETNPLAAELVARDPRYAAQLRRQLETADSARLFVPAERAVEQAWVPNADLRDIGALPAVIVAGRDADALAAEIAALAIEFGAHTAARVTAVEFGATRPLDAYTVGLLSRGMPGFAIDPSGALHLSLMRSCTGWPSGVWLDPPRRRTPDGSAFQLQHWTHEFDYAIVAGAGDWRAVDLVAHGHAFSAPMHARTSVGHAGDLPPTYALLRATPERRVEIQTVKPAGNPSANGAPAELDPAAGLTVRLVETNGLPVRATVFSAFGWIAARHTDLLEQEGRDAVLSIEDDVIITALDASQIATIVGEPKSYAADRDGKTLGRQTEPAQPVYSRYWLHNRGPAPLGFLPVTISAGPTVFTATGEPLDSTITIAGQYTETAVDALLTVDAPQGWVTEPATRPVTLPPGGHTAFPLTIATPGGVAPGLYFVRAQLAVGADTIEDVLTVLVPGAGTDAVLPPPAGPELDQGTQNAGTAADSARLLGLEITAITESVTVRPGGAAELALRVRSIASSPIEGEAMPISPWGTWEFVGPGSKGFRVPPNSDGELTFDIAVPPDARPGRWWILVKLMWFGRIQYSPAIPFVVAA